MNGAEEITSSFVVTSGDGTELLEPGEKIFDQMARPIQVPVKGTLDQVGAARRDHDRFARFFQRLNQPLLCVIGFVRHDGIRRGVGQQDVGADDVVGLSGGKVKPCRIAQSVYRGVDLRAQSSAATSDGLAYFRPLLDGSGAVLAGEHERWRNQS